MNIYIEPFLLGLTLHAGLLFNAIYQNAFILSRGLAGKPVLGTVLVFILSGFLSSMIGVYLFHNISEHNAMFVPIIGTIGAAVLAYQAYRAYVFARSDHTYQAKSGDIFVALAMVWLTPHLYTDMFLLSSLAITRDTSAYIPLIIGFNTMATIWFSALGFFSKKLSKMYSNHKIHKGLHYASAVILALISITIICEVYLDIHLFHDHHGHEIHGHDHQGHDHQEHDHQEHDHQEH